LENQRLMSKFVNYNKRSITLPPGCKDLIDLLREERPSYLPSAAADPEAQESGTIAVAKVEMYVTRCFCSEARLSVLMLSLPDESLGLAFTRLEGELTHACASFTEDPHRDRLMREFLLSHSLRPPRASRGRPPTFVPEIRIQCLYHLRPLPKEAALVARIAVDLFREVCGLGDESELRFQYYEFTQGL
jgi:hypothetical protein